MTDDERLHELTTVLVRKVYGFLGVPEDQVVLPREDWQGALQVHADNFSTNPADHEIALNALGCAVAALIVATENPQAIYHWFGDMLNDTCQEYIKLVEAEARQMKQ